MATPANMVLIAALDQARAIGRDGQLPWHLPDDLRRFKQLTLGRSVLMGRKTFQSIGRPLPQRRNLVLSRDRAFSAAGVEVVHSLDEARSLDEALVVIGGGDVYTQALPWAARLELTLVDVRIHGADAFFPPYSAEHWIETEREHHPADARHAHAFDFVRLERRQPGDAPA